MTANKIKMLAISLCSAALWWWIMWHIISRTIFSYN